jgi:hypothetical protein
MVEERHRDANAAFYVFDAIYDWINNLDLGNGLADLLCHYNHRSNHYDVEDLSPNTFVEYANTTLTHKTSKKEIIKILKYRHPSYSFISKDFIFEIDKNGKVLTSDPIIQCIVEIRNAYVLEYNSRDERRLLFSTAEEAVKNVISQKACIDMFMGMQATGYVDMFNVSDVLDTIVKLKDDNKEYRSSLVNRQLIMEITKLMIRFKNVKQIADKYFDKSGTDCKFYLGGKPQFIHPSIKRMNFIEGFSRSYIDRIVEILRITLPSLGDKRLLELAHRYIVMFTHNPKTDLKYTPMEAMIILIPENRIARSMIRSQLDFFYISCTSLSNRRGYVRSTIARNIRCISS